MKNLQQKDLKKSEVLKVMLVCVFSAFIISCSNEAVESQIDEVSKTDQQNVSNTPNTHRIYYQDRFIVRNWGSHNVDCSQPEGFCSDIYTFTWHYFNLSKPDPTGTPVSIANEKEKFVMTIQKSALTPEHQKVLLRNGIYVIPEGQILAPEIVKSLKLNSDTLTPGKYPIVESEATYTIAIDVNK